MADKEDESNMTSEAEEGDCYSAAQLHGVVELTRSADPVVSPRMSGIKNEASSNCEELTLAVKDASESPVISEFLQGTVQEGTVLGQTSQVVSPLTGDGLLSERNIITSFVETPGIETVTTQDLSAVTSELVDSVSPATTTIIYVQPDGSFVEGTGLTAEEQRQLVEQLAKQQLVEVTENEAARIFEQQRAPPSHYIHSGALAPRELQQVIDQVSKAQQSASHVEQQIVVPTTQRLEPEQPQALPSVSLQPGSLFTTGSPVVDSSARQQPLCIVQNASQQLQNVAKQVALQQSQSQNGTRLIQKKQLETIRIQVQIPPSSQESKPRPSITPLAVGGAPKVGVAGGVNVSAPQIIHIAPVIGQQQYLLTNPGDPPIQLLVQRPAPLVSGAIPLQQKRPPTQTPVNGKASRPGPASSGPAPERKERHREKPKVRRPQKVQTRSGRVSRPPKHKVKDYKFIKTEDLADGRQSDSDDYSEISVEEEEGANGNPGSSRPPAPAVNVYLNAKTFKCCSCDKAYIGLGGLSRHYRLNPTHGEAGSAGPAAPIASAPVSAKPGGDSDALAASAIAMATQAADGTSTSTKQIAPSTTEPVTGATSAPALPPVQGGKAVVQPLQGAPLPSGPGRPRGTGRPGRPRSVAHPARRGRPGRPPKNPGVLQPPQRRARLKEVLQVCDDEDLMEMVLPRLAKVMTLWEFLLMKVDKGQLSRPQFADVYREFEQLHAQVKKMAHDHFSAPHGPGPHTALDVQDLQVCESLGIGHLLTQVKTSLPESAGVPGSQNSAKKAGQRETCKSLPPAKRFKAGKSVSETNEHGAAAHLRLNGTAVTGPAAGADSSHGSGEKTTPQDMCLVTGLPDPAPSPAGELGYRPMEVSPHPQTATLGFTELQTDISTEIGGPAQGPSLAVPEPMAAPGEEPAEVLNESDIADQMQQLERALSGHAVPLDHCYRASGTETPTAPTQGPDQSQHTLHTDSVGAPEDRAVCLGSAVEQTVTLRGTVEEAIALGSAVEQTVAIGGTVEEAIALGSAVEQTVAIGGTVEEAIALGSAVEQTVAIGGAVEEAVSFGGTMEFEVADGGQEQVLIQMEDGLIMHQPGGGVASERIVIVTSPDGTTMHIRTPDTVPLETVQALLGIDGGGQTEE
ncbi:hypothetical protein JZ751_012821, partial [Albula glossodonta]